MKRLFLSLLLIVLLFPAALSADFWASKNSNKYHHPTCPWAKKISPQNLVKFSSLEDTAKSRYIPCKVCKPSIALKSETKNNDNFNLLQPAKKEFYPCTRVVDGDTIVVEIDGVQEKIRLIGVDTPETVHPSKSVEYFGKESSDFTKKIVTGKKVYLEYDLQRRDKYGRLLAYVYLENGIFINAEIIKQGYGFAYTKYPFKYLDEFRHYEKLARENNIGLWNK